MPKQTHFKVFMTMLDRFLYPVFYVLSFPIFIPVLELGFIFLTKAMGISNAYPHSSGISVSEWKFLRRLSRHMPMDSTILDVGFHKGDYTKVILELCPSSRVYGFEPNPHLIEAVPELGENFTLIAAAASAENGIAVFHDVKGGHGTSIGSLHEEQLSIWGQRNVDTVEVATITLDDFSAEQGLVHINLLKVDTEGHDLSVLLGARGILGQGIIDVIQFEFLGVNAMLGNSLGDFIKLLVPQYKIFRLNLGGYLIPIEPYSPRLHEQFGSQNIIALRIGSEAANAFT